MTVEDAFIGSFYYKHDLSGIDCSKPDNWRGPQVVDSSLPDTREPGGVHKCEARILFVYTEKINLETSRIYQMPYRSKLSTP